MPVRRGVSAAAVVAAVVAAGVGARAQAEDPAVTVTAITPARPHAGTPLTVDVTSRTGDEARVCLLPAAGTSRCAEAVPQEDGTRRATFTAPHPGRWTLVVDAGAERVTRRLRILPHGDRLVVLATGDSLVDNLAHGLAGRLRLRRDVALKRSVHLGAGLSRPDGFDWLAEAQASVARWQPDVVVVFLGGNEGYDLDGVPCCAANWVERFADRQRALIRAYAGDGRTRVYWTTLPAPSPDSEARRIVWAAENLALEAATAGGEARVFDVKALLTPRYRWRRSMRWNGRRRVVRDPDGVHLNRTGGRVAAWALLKQLREDGVDVPARGSRPGHGHNVPRSTRTRP